MFLLLFSLACGEKEEDTGILEDTWADTDTEASDTSDTENTDTGETGNSDTSDSGNSDTSDSGNSDTGSSDIPAEQACEELTVDECHTRDDCHTRSGAPTTFDTANECWVIEAYQETHCMSNDMACGDALTYAHAPNSEECWLFTDTCIPQGWTQCTYPDEPECQ